MADDGTFQDQNLSGRDFSNQDLAGAAFIQCDLTGTNFRHAGLAGATFERCRALPEDPEASEAVADFSYADLAEAQMIHCDFTTALFVHASAYGLQLTNCQLQGADFSNCDFRLPIQSASTLARFTMSGCNFSFGDLSNTCLKECELTDNRMIDVLLHNCDLSGADLSGSDLNGMTGTGIDLSGADLRGASFNTLDPRRMSLTGVTMGLTQGLRILDTLEIIIDPDAD